MCCATLPRRTSFFVVLAALCLVILSPAEGRRSRQHQALDLVVSRFVKEYLGNWPAEKRLLLVVNGWGEYTPRERRVTVGPIEPYLEELERLRQSPDYDIWLDPGYRKQAMEKFYPGCVLTIPVLPPTQLPNGDLQITYHRQIGYHLTGNSSFTLRRTRGKWRIIGEEYGRVNW